MIVRSAQDAPAYLRFKLDPGPTRCAPIEDWKLSTWFEPDPRGAAAGPRDWWGRWLRHRVAGNPAPEADLWAVHLPGGPAVEIIQLVPAPQCGCCGTLGLIKRVGPNGADPRDWRYRCEKHVGRAPCLIDPCGRTFALDPHQDYSWEFLCGTHWRQGPRRIRDQIRAIGRKAKKFGWNERLAFLHDHAWRRLIHAIREPQRIDLREIELLFGV